jgi:predicted hydrocarbon binding protein
MAYEINDADIEKLKEADGEVRGVVFKTDEHYVVNTKGEEGIEKVEAELEKMGVKISYKEVDRMAFYPLNLRVFSLIAISRAFNYNEEDVIEMGVKAPRISFLIKFFTKYFMSSEKTLERVGEMWEKHYTKGKVEATEVNEEEGRAIFRVYDIHLHPIFCHYLRGYFSSVISMVVGEKVESRETKCYFNSDEYHEFYMTWDTESNK